jgi:hypothetical protein
LVGHDGLGVITQALKTSFRTGIVNLAGKQIKLNQLIFPSQETSTNSACLSVIPIPDSNYMYKG